MQTLFLMFDRLKYEEDSGSLVNVLGWHLMLCLPIGEEGLDK